MLLEKGIQFTFSCRIVKKFLNIYNQLLLILSPISQDLKLRSLYLIFFYICTYIYMYINVVQYILRISALALNVNLI